MSTKICLYCEVHQPKRLRAYKYWDIKHQHDYEDHDKNREILQKVATKCYLPTNNVLMDVIRKYGTDFKIAFSISGMAIEQFKRFSPETLESFKRLADTGCVEFLNETYYHSLSSLYSDQEFKNQVQMHQTLIEKEFGQKATTFRNTELIYNNHLAKLVESLGYRTMLAEGADKILGWRSPNYVYQALGTPIKLLLRNYRLSDDIAFRFSDRTWPGFPLDADKYAHWLHALHGQAPVINLFMDYETFGEHQWAETGIFNFLKHLPYTVMKHPDFSFATPREISHSVPVADTLDVPHFISWADEARDLTAWTGNELQEDALKAVYKLEKSVYATQDEDLLHIWRSLLTSDHYYYMCTKYAQDGDVHKYFNPYQNPYEAYINFQNILSDFILEIEKKTGNDKAPV